MSFLLCCLVNKMIDNDIDLEPAKYNKENNKEINENFTPVNTPVKKYREKSQRNKVKVDTLIEIKEFETCQYWFYEVIKYSIPNFKYYHNSQKELCEHIFKYVDFYKITSHYKKYIEQYKNFNKDNIVKFCDDKNNIDLIQDIKICENMFSFKLE